jgi:hypothetical protein
MEAGAISVAARIRPGPPASKKRFHCGLDNVCVLKSYNLFAQYSLAVVKHCCWQPFDAAKLLLQVVWGDCQRIMHPDFLGELDGVFRIHHGIELKSDDGKSAGAVEVEEFLIAGHFFFAWLAPSGPKINEYDLAAKVSRGDFAAPQVFHGEFWQMRANLACRNCGLNGLGGTRRMLFASGESESGKAQK